MSNRPAPRSFEVLSTGMVTPNMRRVSIGGAALADFPAAQDGGYLKLRIPGATPQGKAFVRTYTIIRQTADALDIDFALHGGDGDGGGGPAASWALAARPGDRIEAGGPGPAKRLAPGADWYLLAGDMTALPAITVNLADLPGDAVGHALIEVQTEADRQDLPLPEGVSVEWLINPEPGHHPELFERALRALPWREGRVQAWCATEFEAMRRARQYLRAERGLTPEQLYISSYWKLGLVEDEHREVKRADSMAAPA
ncbi:siderophore-interacting protein [Pseudogemmobacter sonorensis]|uniref:siderophore-interacting protein n=1 Tax=Pseudogemmobacter sonorensis TaxID=2989681 RepID=UPI0036A9962C